MAAVIPDTPVYPDPIDWRGGSVITSSKVKTICETINHLMAKQGASYCWSQSFPDGLCWYDDVEPETPHLSVIVPMITDRHGTLTIRCKVGGDAVGIQSIRFYSQGNDNSSTINPPDGTTWAATTLLIAPIADKPFDILDVFLGTTGDPVYLHSVHVEYAPLVDIDRVITTGEDTLAGGFEGWGFGDAASAADLPLSAGRGRALMKAINHLIYRPRVIMNWSALANGDSENNQQDSMGFTSLHLDFAGFPTLLEPVYNSVISIPQIGELLTDYRLRVGGTVRRYDIGGDSVSDPDAQPISDTDGVNGVPIWPRAAMGLNRWTIEDADSGGIVDPTNARITRACIWGP